MRIKSEYTHDNGILIGYQDPIYATVKYLCYVNIYNNI